MNLPLKTRAAVIADLTERIQGGIGRTALMKLMYFLQALRQVPLGYSFRLYTYGPYDGQVLDDLKTAEGMGGVVSDAFEWQGGAGYAIRPGQRAQALLIGAAADLARLKCDIEWVVEEFGNRSASDLELASTAIFVDRSLSGAIAENDLISRIHSIKPHHNESKIGLEVEKLKKKGLFQHLSA
jgi:uncharacterized protein